MSKYWLFYILRVQPQQKGKICNVCCKKNKRKAFDFHIFLPHSFYTPYFYKPNIEDKLMQPFPDIAETLLK